MGQLLLIAVRNLLSHRRRTVMLGGAIADARDRRTVILVTEVVFTILSALLLVNALLPEPLLWEILPSPALRRGCLHCSGRRCRPSNRNSSNAPS